MKINQLLQRAKARGEYSKRRVGALADHSRKVVTTGFDVAQDVATVAIQTVKKTLQAQRLTLTDTSLPVRSRVQKIKVDLGTSFADAKTEISALAKAGYSSVAEKLSHVADVTHKEQALENKTRRKAAKALKTAERHAAA